MSKPDSLPPADRDDWFTRLVGFSERDPDEVRNHIVVDGNQLTSKINDRTYRCGTLEVISLADLRQKVAQLGDFGGKLSVGEVVGDAKALHADTANQGATFQVASQFNLLEMVHPQVTPEQGVGIYQNDPTQGPACAIACGAGTIFRNYFVPVGGQIGQSVSEQIDCLSAVGVALGNVDSRLWKMRNGYALPSEQGMQEIDAKLRSLSESEIDALRSSLSVGIQWDTQVTIGNASHLVSQVYCSAMPVAYSRLSSHQWERFARLILEAAYEATLATAMIQSSRSRNKNLYLTLLGGGAFGNDQQWILDAIVRACILYRSADLSIKIVSFAKPNPRIGYLIQSL
jgi:lipoprotein signal peptidase